MREIITYKAADDDGGSMFSEGRDLARDGGDRSHAAEDAYASPEYRHEVAGVVRLRLAVAEEV